MGFVEQDPESGKYQLGAALLHMGARYLDGNELRTRALNWSDSLASRSGESVRIGTLHEGQVLVVHHVFRPDDSRQALEVGALCPRTPARSARCCSPPTATPPLSSRRGAAAVHPATITDPDALAPQLQRGARARLGHRRRGARRRRGVDRGADRGPPRRHGGRDRDLRPGRAAVRGRRAPRTDLVSNVREAARAVSRDLGAIPW